MATKKITEAQLTSARNKLVRLSKATEKALKDVDTVKFKMWEMQSKLKAIENTYDNNVKDLNRVWKAENDFRQDLIKKGIYILVNDNPKKTPEYVKTMAYSLRE